MYNCTREVRYSTLLVANCSICWSTGVQFCTKPHYCTIETPSCINHKSPTATVNRQPWHRKIQLCFLTSQLAVRPRAASRWSSGQMLSLRQLRTFGVCVRGRRGWDPQANYCISRDRPFIESVSSLCSGRLDSITNAFYLLMR